MRQKIKVSASYFAGTTAVVDLPEGVVWDDFKDWHINWDSLFYKLKDESNTMPYHEIRLDSNTLDIIDWKRPTDATIYICDEEEFEIDEIDHFGY